MVTNEPEQVTTHMQRILAARIYLHRGSQKAADLFLSVTSSKKIPDEVADKIS